MIITKTTENLYLLMMECHAFAARARQTAQRTDIFTSIENTFKYKCVAINDTKEVNAFCITQC